MYNYTLRGLCMISITHPSGKVSSTTALSFEVVGGTTTAPKNINLSASSVIMPNVQQPVGQTGAIIFDTSSSKMKYYDGFKWIEWVAADDVMQPIQADLADIYNKLDTKVDTVVYSSSSVANASISGTTLYITFPSSSGSGSNTTPGLFTSLPNGSITNYALSSGQTPASIREQMGGSTGSQTGRTGTAALPYITSSGWCYSDGNYWVWQGPNGNVTVKVPNLNQNAYMKAMSTTGITKTDAVIAASGSIGDTALTAAQIPSHNHTFSANTNSTGAHTHSITLGYHGDGGNGSDSGPDYIRYPNGSGALFTDLSTNSAGAHSHTVSGTTSSTGSGQTHGHSLNSVDVAHFNVAVLYNIAQPSLALNQDTGDSRYVLKSGDTMTGALTVANSLSLKANDSNLVLYFRNSANTERAVIYHSSANNTLRFRANSGTEVSIDTSGRITTPLLTAGASTITGAMTVSSTLAVTGNATVGSKNVVRSVNGTNADTTGNVTIAVTNTTASMAQNGWHLDSTTGMLEQWGIQTSTGNGSFTVTYPRAFSEIYNVSVTRIGSSDSPTVAVNSITTTNFVVKQADGGNGGSYWRAIGRL